MGDFFLDFSISAFFPDFLFFFSSFKISLFFRLDFQRGWGELGFSSTISTSPKFSLDFCAPGYS